MNLKKTNTNISFDFLKDSNDFLVLILNNIHSCVLLLDSDLKLFAFNDALKTIFSNRKDENLLYEKCGEAIGCAHQIEEQTECGTSSKCIYCDLKVAALSSYLNNVAIFKERVKRPFYNFYGEKIEKYLQFSTRVFEYKMERYVLMIIDDITELENIKENILK